MQFYMQKYNLYIAAFLSREDTFSALLRKETLEVVEEKGLTIGKICGIINTTLNHAGVAQLVEQLIRNQ